MYARVKEKHNQRVTTACGGREYIKGEWRPVPEHEQLSAQANPALEVTETPPVVEKTEAKAPPAPKAKANRAGTVRLVDRSKDNSVSVSTGGDA